jgi:Catalase
MSQIKSLVPSPRGKRLFLLGFVVAACGGRAAVSSTNGALSISGLTNFTTPDPGNIWTQGQDLTTYAIGQENVLPSEQALFAQMVTDINSMQDQLSSMNGGVARGFHAKPHACVLGTFNVASDSLSSAQQRGLFQTDASYPVWVRFSNGVGFSEKDGDVDVRGLALKVMQVPGGGTQDFLMTNGPVTPAPDAAQFVKFGQAQVAATVAGTPSSDP